MVAGEAYDLVVAEHIRGEALQRVLRADFDEDPCALVVQRPQSLHELHGRRDLAAEEVEHLLHGPLAQRIELAGDVCDGRQLGRTQAEALEHRPQRFARGRHDLGVEAVADGQRDRGVPALLNGLHRPSDRLGGPAEHDLMRRVDVGEHDVAVDPCDDLLGLRQRGHHRGHRPGVVHLKTCHLAPARADGLERILERQPARADECAVLADGVAHHHVGSDPVFAQEKRERGVNGDHGRLLDLGAAELVLRPRHRGRIPWIGEDDVREPATLEQRSHQRIGLLEQLRDDRLPPAQLGEHVRVLGALAGVQERHLAGTAAAAVDAARAQRRPRGGIARLQHAQRQLRLGHQVGRVGIVDRDPLGRAQHVA